MGTAQSNAKHAKMQHALVLARQFRYITSTILQLRLGVTERSAQRYLRELADAGALQKLGSQPRRYQITTAGQELVAA